MDGVRVALRNRGMTVEAARQCAKDMKEWRALMHMLLDEFRAVFLLGNELLLTALPGSGGYHLGRDGMPLHDVVGVNCKKGATTENQGADVKYVYGLRGVCWMIVYILSVLT